MRISIKHSPVGKPSGYEKQLTYGWANTQLSPAALVSHICSGKPLAVAQFKSGHRRKANFIASDVIGLDYDKLNEQPITDAQFSDLLTSPFIQENAFAVIPTFSDAPNARRVRVLFKLSETITDPDTYAELVQVVMELAPDGADDAARDPARAFAGSKPGTSAAFTKYSNVLDVASLLKAIRIRREDREKRAQQRGAVTGEMPSDFISAIEKSLGATEYDDKGWSNLLPCPLKNHEHDDTRPAARWHRDKHICKCFKCHGEGEYALAIQVADRLNISPRDFANWEMPSGEAASNEAAIPDWMIEKLLSLHQIGHFLDHAAAALVLLQRNQQVTKYGLSGEFTLQEFVDYSAMMGSNTNEKTARRGLEQCAALGFYTKEIKPTDGKGRPPTLYHPRKWADALATFNEKLSFRAFEKAYGQFTPAAASAAWFPDDEPETAERLADYINRVSAQVYHDCQEEIAQAEQKYQSLLEVPAFRLNPPFWSKPAELPTGTMETGREFREKYGEQQAKKRAAEGRNITVSQAAAQIGISQVTLSKYREKWGVVTDAQFKEIEVNPQKDVLRQVDSRAKWAEGRRFGRYLQSSSGSEIPLNPDSPAAINAWAQKETAAGHHIVARIQIGSLERFTSLDEVQQRKLERKETFGNREAATPPRHENALPELHMVLETFPETYRRDWLEAQYSLRPVDPLVMEAIRIGAVIHDLPEEQDLIPYLIPYEGIAPLNRVSNREKNTPGIDHREKGGGLPGQNDLEQSGMGRVG